MCFKPKNYKLGLKNLNCYNVFVKVSSTIYNHVCYRKSKNNVEGLPMFFVCLLESQNSGFGIYK